MAFSFFNFASAAKLRAATSSASFLAFAIAVSWAFLSTAAAAAASSSPSPSSVPSLLGMCLSAPRLHVSIYAAPYEQLLSPRPCAWGLEFYALRSCFALLLAIVSLCWHGVPPSPANVYTEPTSLLKGMHWKLEPVLAKTVGLAYPVRDHKICACRKGAMA